jgi:hypothetical protein
MYIAICFYIKIYHNLRLLIKFVSRWFSPGPPVSSTNKTDRHDIAEILLKMALNTTKQTYIKEAFEYSPSQQHFCMFGNTAV